MFVVHDHCSWCCMPHVPGLALRYQQQLQVVFVALRRRGKFLKTSQLAAKFPHFSVVC